MPRYSSSKHLTKSFSTRIYWGALVLYALQATYQKHESYKPFILFINKSLHVNNPGKTATRLLRRFTVSTDFINVPILYSKGFIHNGSHFHAYPSSA